MPFWQFSRNRLIGWNSQALLVQPSISAHRKWKWSTFCGSYEFLACLECWIISAYSFGVRSVIKTVCLNYARIAPLEMHLRWVKRIVPKQIDKKHLYICTTYLNDCKTSKVLTWDSLRRFSIEYFNNLKKKNPEF